jgi:hypothetical protein
MADNKAVDFSNVAADVNLSMIHAKMNSYTPTNKL